MKIILDLPAAIVFQLQPLADRQPQAVAQIVELGLEELRRTRLAAPAAPPDVMDFLGELETRRAALSAARKRK
jgi:hypothetical protein